MNRKLLWGLVATGGASLAVSWLPGDDAAEIAHPTIARRAPQPMSAQAADVQANARNGVAFAAAAPRTREAGVDREDAAPPPRIAALAAESASTLTRQEPAAAPDEGAAGARRDWPALAGPARSAWQPPPPPPRPPEPPPPPPAPPPPAFPYQWIGKIDNAGKVHFFLAGPQRTLAVKAGETVDQRWRIEGAEAGRLQVTWLGTGAVVQVTPVTPP